MAEEAYPDDYGDAPKMPEDRFNKVNISVIQDISYFCVKTLYSKRTHYFDILFNLVKTRVPST